MIGKLNAKQVLKGEGVVMQDMRRQVRHRCSKQERVADWILQSVSRVPQAPVVKILTLLVPLLGFSGGVGNAAADAIDFDRQIAPLFTKYCVACHNSEDREGDLLLETYNDLMSSQRDHPLVVAGEAEASQLLRVLNGTADIKMPPEDQPGLTQQEIGLIRQWLDQGALNSPESSSGAPRLGVPRIQPAREQLAAVTALALSPDGQTLAIARFGRIEFIESVLQEKFRSIDDLPGKINALSYSPDGSQLVAATGITGLYGRTDLYTASGDKLLRSFVGHHDIVADAELSPDGELLASCSYDHKIIVWRVRDGRKLREITGHNGAVFDIEFSPDGAVLASASADETVKLWNVASGQRLDTLSQPQAEQYVVGFSPDSRFVVAGGGDNRIRVWEFHSKEKPQINPLRYTRFAHEGALIGLGFSPDGTNLVSTAEDFSMKLWETETFSRSTLLARQPDVVSGLALSESGDQLVVGRLNGTWETVSIQSERQALRERIADVQATTTPSQVAGETELPETPPDSVEEVEPNDLFAQAMALELPALVHGKIFAPGEDVKPDLDFYRFSAKSGERLLFEIRAADKESLLDSHLEVLREDGSRIERVFLQAVRDSYYTFIAINSDAVDGQRLHNWEEMELNELLYAKGEVCKLWLYPNGPDAGFTMYPGEGKRFTYFDTSAITHALNETCFIVEPHPPGAELVPTGLPVFPIYFENDDDAMRELGSDSRLYFTAPQSGNYVVRVTDVRGFGGHQYHYDLTVRHPQPDFEVTVEMDEQSISAGGAGEFTLRAKRVDGFEGEIHVDVRELPAGFFASAPIAIQEGQTFARGVIRAVSSAVSPSADDCSRISVTAVATIKNQTVEKRLAAFERLELVKTPEVLIRVVSNGSSPDFKSDDLPTELFIAPGETISARVIVQRHDMENVVLFGRDDSGRNLPHGVHVDNVGLNGLMIRANENEREFFLTAAKWIPETTRMFHLKANKDKRSGIDREEACWPVILHVRKPVLADNQSAKTP